MSLPARFKIIREALGLSQKEMAKTIEISLPGIQGYEAGRSVPGGNVIEALVKLGFNANWLLTGEGEMRLGDAGQGSHIDVSIDHKPVNQHLEPGDVKVDPVMTVIKHELQRMTVDQKRAVLKLCMDITGEQYALVKNSSQNNREQRLKKTSKEVPGVGDTEFEGWEW